MAIPKGTYTYDQVAQRYGVAKMTVYRWVKSGILKKQKLAGRTYFTKESLIAFEKRKAV